jgi:methionyl-tRNA formyltransferase
MLRPTSTTAAELALTIRALTPHIGAMFELEGGDPLRVEAARAVADAIEPGTATAVDGRLLVGTASGSLELLRVKPAGGKAMDVESFLRGNAVPELAQGSAEPSE